MPASHFDITLGPNQTQVWLPIMQIPRYWRDSEGGLPLSLKLLRAGGATVREGSAQFG